MKPYYEEAGITIYHGDCREILPTLPKVDLVLTDPPYSISVAGAVNHSPKGSRNFDFFPGDDDWVAMTKAVSEALSLAVSLNPRSFVAWCGHRQIGQIVDLLERADYSTRMLFWRKRCPPPSAPGAGFSSAVEQAVYGYKAGRTWTGGQYEANVFDADNYRHGQPGKVDHPTQKPLSLIDWNINLLSIEGESLVDPFMGSGTTLVAAKKLSRTAIGIEREEKYCEIAANRLRQGVLWGAE